MKFHLDENVLTAVINPDGKWNHSEFPHPLVTLDYDEDYDLIAVVICGISDEKPRSNEVTQSRRAYSMGLLGASRHSNMVERKANTIMFCTGCGGYNVELVGTSGYFNSGESYRDGETWICNDCENMITIYLKPHVEDNPLMDIIRQELEDDL